LFRKEEFRYDPTSDTYRCPGGLGCVRVG